MCAQLDPRRAHVLRPARQHPVRHDRAASPGCVIGWRPDNGLARRDRRPRRGRALRLRAELGDGLHRPAGQRPRSRRRPIGLLVLFPLAFVSSCFVPTQGLPGWLRMIADWNPVSAVAASCRELFGNPNPRGADRHLPRAASRRRGRRVERGHRGRVRPAGELPAAPPHPGLTMIASGRGELLVPLPTQSASVAPWSAVTSHSNASAVVARWVSFGGGGTRYPDPRNELPPSAVNHPTPAADHTPVPPSSVMTTPWRGHSPYSVPSGCTFA